MISEDRISISFVPRITTLLMRATMCLCNLVLRCLSLLHLDFPRSPDFLPPGNKVPFEFKQVVLVNVFDCLLGQMVLLLALCATALLTLNTREVYLAYLIVYYLRDTYWKGLPSAGQQRIPLICLMASYCKSQETTFICRKGKRIHSINKWERRAKTPLPFHKLYKQTEEENHDTLLINYSRKTILPSSLSYYISVLLSLLQLTALHWLVHAIKGH